VLVLSHLILPSLCCILLWWWWCWDGGRSRPHHRAAAVISSHRGDSIFLHNRHLKHCNSESVLFPSLCVVCAVSFTQVHLGCCWCSGCCCCYCSSWFAAFVVVIIYSSGWLLCVALVAFTCACIIYHQSSSSSTRWLFYIPVLIATNRLCLPRQYSVLRYILVVLVLLLLDSSIDFSSLQLHVVVVVARCRSTIISLLTRSLSPTSGCYHSLAALSPPLHLLCVCVGGRVYCAAYHVWVFVAPLVCGIVLWVFFGFWFGHCSPLLLSLVAAYLAPGSPSAVFLYPVN